MGQRNVEIPALESEFDDDAAISMLGITFNKGVSKSITDSEMLRKSFFDFDLISEEGLQKLLNLLPVLDYEIVKDVVESMWPAYPTDGLNPATTRMELKGFILDYLNEINTEPADSAGYSDTE